MNCITRLLLLVGFLGMTSCSGFVSPTPENTKKVKIKLMGVSLPSAVENEDILIFAEDKKVYRIEGGEKSLDAAFLQSYKVKEVALHLPKMWFNQVGERVAQLAVKDSIIYTEFK